MKKCNYDVIGGLISSTANCMPCINSLSFDKFKSNLHQLEKIAGSVVKVVLAVPGFNSCGFYSLQDWDYI